MKRNFKWAVVLAALFAFAAAGCSDDDDPVAPKKTGSVAGKVTFQGTWPNVGEIQISVYSNLQPPYIPMGPPDASTDPLLPANEFDYKLDGLDQGAYSAIYISWRDPLNPSGAKLLGMYWAQADSVGIGMTGLPVEPPLGFDIDESYPQYTDYDIQADLDKAN